MPAQAPEQFVEWLNQEWASRKISTREAMRITKVSHSLFADALNGTLPSFETCVAIGKVLGIPAETVLRRAGLLPPKPEHDDTWDELQTLYGDADTAARELFIELARTVLTRTLKQKQGEHGQRGRRRPSGTDADVGSDGARGSSGTGE